MKKRICFVLSLFCVVGLLGCSGKINADTTNGSSYVISSDMLGQGIYEELQEEWEAWDSLSEEQKMFSSHMPGHCYERFDDWAECEEFLGFSLFNPLEDCEWLEKGTYVGMPLGFADASRFYVSLYGTNEGQVEWIHVESGYRNGEVRITVNAQIEVDTPKENLEDEEPLITEDSGERYVASTALVAQGPVTYSIRVIGEPNRQTQVRETLEKILPYFENTLDK